MADRSLLALDVGGRRIGVARAGVEARIPEPLTTIENNEDVLDTIAELLASENIAILVVGLPRGLEGQETEQTRFTHLFIERLKKITQLPIYTQDEAVTSLKAYEELQARGKPFEKKDIDALAAAYILQDFIDTKSELIEEVKKPA